MKATVIVRSVRAAEPYRFVIRLHRHSSPEQFFLHPNEFYEKWGGKIPSEHHELEVLEPDRKTLERKPLHLENSKKSSNPFVCYPSALPTLEEAVEVLRVWCCGAVLTWEHDIDLNTVSQVCNGDNKKILDIFNSGYRIYVAAVLID